MSGVICPATIWSRILNFWIFPEGVIGNESAKNHIDGTLCAEIRSRHYFLSSSGSVPGTGTNHPPPARRIDRYDLHVTPVEAKHAFISYVKEDSERVDGLCKVLDAANIPYWRDRKDLAPGANWKATIREAIRSAALVYIACFSENSLTRHKSVMNEELTLAVEEFRLMPPRRDMAGPCSVRRGTDPRVGPRRRPIARGSSVRRSLR